MPSIVDFSGKSIITLPALTHPSPPSAALTKRRFWYPEENSGLDR
jgi:hypothetical protein